MPRLRTSEVDAADNLDPTSETLEGEHEELEEECIRPPILELSLTEVKVPLYFSRLLC